MSVIVPAGPRWPAKERELCERIRPFLQRKALEARVEGFHYNGFVVGFAGFGFTSEGKPVLAWGSNYKDEPGSLGPKVCAEEDGHMHAYYKGCVRMLCCVVAAFQKPDDTTGFMHEGCLPPCMGCMRRMVEDVRENGIFRPQTEVQLLRLKPLEDGRVKVDHIAKPFTVGALLKQFPVQLSDGP